MLEDKDTSPCLKYFDYENLEKSILELQSKYDFVEVNTLTQSILGKRIPRITLGKGKKSVIYIGAHHGMEWITSALLMKFASDFCDEYKNGSLISDISSRVLFESR